MTQPRAYREAIAAAREQARRDGRRTFLPPVPCVNGHMAPRYTGAGNCTVCVQSRNQRQHEMRRHQEREQTAPLVQLTRDWQPFVIKWQPKGRRRSGARL